MKFYVADLEQNFVLSLSVVLIQVQVMLNDNTIFARKLFQMYVLFQYSLP